MRGTVLGVALAAIGLSGCVVVDASRGDGKPVALESETIRYETGACHGTCPVYAVTIAPDGEGTFEGKRFTTVAGTRTFQASAAAYHLFAARLAPYRPHGSETIYQPGTPDCRNAPTDLPSVDVTWSEASGGRQHLAFYYGCGDPAMREALRGAPALLPIAGLIGTPQRPGAS